MFSIALAAITLMPTCCQETWQAQIVMVGWLYLHLGSRQSVRKSAFKTDCSTPVYVAQLGASSHCVPDVYACPTHMALKSLELMSKPKPQDCFKRKMRPLEQPSRLLRVDAGQMKQAWTQGWQGWSERLESLPWKMDCCTVTVKKSSRETLGQMVLPKEFREIVMRAMHDDLGHLGQERTVDLPRRRCFWPRMFLDVEEYIKNCGECVIHKMPVQSLLILEVKRFMSPVTL